MDNKDNKTEDRRLTDEEYKKLPWITRNQIKIGIGILAFLFLMSILTDYK